MKYINEINEFLEEAFGGWMGFVLFIILILYTIWVFKDVGTGLF